MKKRITLWKEGEYNYPGAGEFVPFMVAHLHDDDEVHPAMIVAPGGGFILLQPMEAEGPADKFFGMGYNTFVLMYTNNVTLDKPAGRQAIQDASRAIKMIRKNSKEWGVDPDRIAAFGSSGGGYMVTAMATLHDQPEMAADDEYDGISNRINAVIMNYALVTGGKYTCPGAYDMLLGKDATAEEIAQFSLENRVTETTAPMFILHGTHDLMVPEQNVQLMTDACMKHGVPHEVHLFSGCNHGFTFINYPAEYTANSFYVFEQLYHAIKAMSPEEFASYSDLLGDLRQDMTYEEFGPVALEKTMMKLWSTGLKKAIDIVAVEMSNAMLKAPYMMKTHGTAEYCLDMANDWLTLLWS